MAIQTPISTISYNTLPFLKEKLQMLYNAHKIQAYQFIHHKGEDGDKDHTHLRIEPNMRLDPMELSEILTEWKDAAGNPISPDSGKKPLGCRPWRGSKEEDWFLYAVHDEDYLAFKYGGPEKGEKLPYKWQDIQVSPNYDLETAFIRAKASQKHTTANLAKRIREGADPLKLIMEGENPFAVNVMMRAFFGNDYSRLAKEHEDLTQKYNKLVQAVKGAGFEIKEDDTGKITIG